jgi:hypothetical protein
VDEEAFNQLKNQYDELKNELEQLKNQNNEPKQAEPQKVVAKSRFIF